PDGHEPAGARRLGGDPPDQGRRGDPRHPRHRADGPRDVVRPRARSRGRLRRLRHQAGRAGSAARQDRGAPHQRQGMTLARKLLVKPGYRLAVVNPPPGYSLEGLPEGAQLAEGDGLDFVQLFVKDSAELERLGPPTFQRVKPDGLLWVCYPKGGKKAGTDLHRDILWEKMSAYGLTGVSLVAVDDTWSAMRFRPADKVGR